MVRVGLVVGILLSCLPGSVFAQPSDDQTKALARVQAQVDTLAALVQPAPWLFGSTDIVSRQGNLLYVTGWAFDCQTGATNTIELELDGVIREGSIAWRGNRPDVQSVYAPMCPLVPLQTGVTMVFDLTNYWPTAIHSTALRIRTATGWKRFNVKMVNMWAEP